MVVEVEAGEVEVGHQCMRREAAELRQEVAEIEKSYLWESSRGRRPWSCSTSRRRSVCIQVESISNRRGGRTRPGLLRTDDALFLIIFACDTEVVVYWWSNCDFASGEGNLSSRSSKLKT